MASRARVCHGGGFSPVRRFSAGVRQHLVGDAHVGLDAVDAVLLVLTFGMTLLTYGSGRTNILLGAVHLLLFCTYIALILER